MNTTLTQILIYIEFLRQSQNSENIDELSFKSYDKIIPGKYVSKYQFINRVVRMGLLHLLGYI